MLPLWSNRRERFVKKKKSKRTNEWHCFFGCHTLREVWKEAKEWQVAHKYSENVFGFLDMCIKMIVEWLQWSFVHFGGEEIKDVEMINSPPFSKLSVKLDTRIKNGWKCIGETWILTTKELQKLVTVCPNGQQVSLNSMLKRHDIQKIIPSVYGLRSR
jgi:hypothetical protein